ncbi:DUF4136 domain-containing protein [Enterovibrio calviensis]|uniref:DUF4136 domain-containing protein n=1 Tax=Enterovibrio calviensis TaxID=91359 RepID=UPI000481CCEA|nr:DUF4136 domain-containing protein [Enterovibrio calviensis]
MYLRLISLFFMLTLVGCAKNVYTDYDQQYAYNDIQSYEIVGPEGSSPSSLDDGRVKQAVSAELAAMGLTETDSEPNVNVRYFIEPKTENVAFGSSVRFGYGSRRFGMGYETPTRYEERSYGQLVVEMVDPMSNQVIWRAVSKRKLTDRMTPSSKNALIKEQVKEMFEEFPPIPK